MKLIIPLLALLYGHALAATKKPLQIYILTGQSNIQGHAKISTIEHIGMDPATKPMHDDKHARLRQLARHRDISANRLVEELATISIAEFEAETRFRTHVAQVSAKKGIAILYKLDATFASKRK